MNYLINLIVIVIVDCSDSINRLPKHGVEFYFRDDEFRDGSKDRLRVVHIGISKRIKDRARFEPD